MHPDHHPWTKEELETLERLLSKVSAATITKRLKRTETSVVMKIKALSHSRRVSEGYTMHDLEECLGEDHHKIQKWIPNGWLRDRRQGNQRHDGNGHDIHRFREKDILAFIKQHPQEINLGKVSQLWFLDLVLLRGKELRESAPTHEPRKRFRDDVAAQPHWKPPFVARKMRKAFTPHDLDSNRLKSVNSLRSLNNPTTRSQIASHIRRNAAASPSSSTVSCGIATVCVRSFPLETSNTASRADGQPCTKARWHQSGFFWWCGSGYWHAGAERQQISNACGGSRKVAVGGSHRLILAVAGLVALIAVFLVVLILRRPKDEEKAVDSEAFLTALKEMSPKIRTRCDTPREIRGFLNYLRFLAARDDLSQRPRAEGFEAQLVRLAALGLKDGMPPSGVDPNVVRFFMEQREMLGLDPATFRAKGESSP